MAFAKEFSSVVASVFPSGQAEITISKQPVLADTGREVRAAISQLPPDVSRSLLSNYAAPEQKLVTSMESAIIARELAIDNAEKGVGLDMNWLNNGLGRKMSEVGLSEDDSWNMAP